MEKAILTRCLSVIAFLFAAIAATFAEDESLNDRPDRDIPEEQVIVVPPSSMEMMILKMKDMCSPGLPYVYVKRQKI